MSPRDAGEETGGVTNDQPEMVPVESERTGLRKRTTHRLQAAVSATGDDGKTDHVREALRSLGLDNQ